MGKRALLITDVTNCFCPPDGELAVPKGDEVVRPIIRIFRYAELNPNQYALIVLSRDWHDKDSRHFKKWPEHGVKFTNGSEFCPGLPIVSSALPVAIISKGLRHLDGYSPFDPAWAVNIILLVPHGNAYVWEGDLDSLFKHFDVDTVINTGLALNYCVKAGSLAARDKGYQVYLPLDACRGINVDSDPENSMENALQEMYAAGVIFTTTAQILQSAE